MVRLTQEQLNDVLAGRYEIIPDAPKSVSGMIGKAELEESVKTALLDWCRLHRKDTRYTAAVIRNLIDLAKKHTALYGAEAVCDTIRECIANGYKGIAWDKIQKCPRVGYYHETVDIEHLKAIYEKVKRGNRKK